MLLATSATLLVTDHYEQGAVRTIGYKDRLKEYINSFSWASKLSKPTIISKERIDLQRSKTGTKMFFSFAFPLGILTFMNWFIDKGLPIQVDFNTIFYGVMVGFFGTMIYSWLNTIDSPTFYSTLPVTVSDVIRARLVLFFTITWWIPLLFLTLIAYMSSEINLLPIGVIVMITVGMYIVNYTAWSTGLRTNSVQEPYPEEANRRFIGQIANLNFAPTTLAKENLEKSDVLGEIHVTGNTVVDALMFISNQKIQSNVLDGYEDKELILLTIHRRENWGNNLKKIIMAIKIILNQHKDVVFFIPVHPNKIVRDPICDEFSNNPNVIVSEPLDYIDLLFVIQKSI